MACLTEAEIRKRDELQNLLNEEYENIVEIEDEDALDEMLNKHLTSPAMQRHRDLVFRDVRFNISLRLSRS